MMRSKLLIFAVVCGSAFSVAAQDSTPQTRIDVDTTIDNFDKAGDTSIGLKWGDLTGVEFKHWSDQSRAFVLSLAFQRENAAVGVDHLWHFRNAVASVTNIDNANAFAPYLGAGVITAFGGGDKDYFRRNRGDFAVAIRAPIGIEFLPRRLNLSLFGEFAPTFGVAPTSFNFLAADIGARYYF